MENRTVKLVMRLSFKSLIKKIAKSKLLIIVLCLATAIKVLDVVFPLPEQPEFSKVITARDGTLLTSYLTSDDKWRLRTKLEEVTPELIEAIINKEDSWFYWHPGVNPFAVLRAAYQNVTSGKRVSGASTITMQLVRILDPSERTYLNKLIEMFRAFQYELHYSKDEILEMYLSCIPMGGNIEGVKAASYLYFNRPPDKLSLAQAVVFAILPNNPNRFRLDKYSAEIENEKRFWLNYFRAEEVFKTDNIETALEETIGAERYNMPVIAPHFCREVAVKFSSENLHTTLDVGLQQSAERILYNYINTLQIKGIYNGALLVLDNNKNEVVAYCGSADFYNNETSGQVNGVTAVRSPGSALKPFLYAAQIDKGTFTPAMRLLDVPTDFSGYFPENYDETFNGSVTLKDALTNSLNVPAVRLLEDYGFINFSNLMISGGMSVIEKQKVNLGLSIILGGCGVTLEELTVLYSTFAKNGRYSNPDCLAVADSNKSSKQLFSADASYIISNILVDNERPDFPNILSEATKLPKIAWKTGTSYGKRDAWAIGYNPNYTIGVWVGNFDGKGSPFLSGKEIAVPLLFSLFNTIDYNPDKKWFDKPRSTGIREVCAETGLIPTVHCSHLIEDYFIEKITHNRQCDLVKEIYVNAENNVIYCKECLPVSGYHKEYFKFYDPELLAYYKQNSIKFAQPPSHNPNCTSITSTEKPNILSPSSDMQYFVENNSNQKIMLQASSPLNIKTHFWYINDKYIGKTEKSGKIFFRPEEGKVNIICINDAGAENKMKITVKYF